MHTSAAPGIREGGRSLRPGDNRYTAIITGGGGADVKGALWLFVHFLVIQAVEFLPVLFQEIPRSPDSS